MAVLNVVQSFGGLRWEMQQGNEQTASALAQNLHLPDVVARILAARGITPETAEAFLHPTLRQHLPNPLTLKDMEKAANRMADAIQAGEPIGLMGDYDVDGATSTAIMKMFLQENGITVYTFIPEREDGYGPNTAKMHEFKDKGCHVVATLDCGTTAFDPIAEGTKIGLDVLVLDHHDAESRLPQAYAVVNPKRLDESEDHPCRYMAAVGVVFLFTVALNTVLRNRGFYTDKRPEPNLMKYLDLVAFGTVCDVMRLRGVNRLFVKAGLKQMQKGENKGLAALAAQVKLAEPPESYHLGYVFGPRVNACGRVGHSDLGMRLLSCQDAIQAAALAQQLDDLNLTRRDIEAAVLLEAMEQAESRPPKDAFILVKGENWHQGVVGIVAGRLKDRYNMPVFALSIEGDEIKGSSRSVQGIDLGTLIMNALAAGILSRGGGHPMAAGFSLKKERLDDFYRYLQVHITPEKCQSHPTTLDIDGILDIGGATPQLVQTLNILAPFGEANAEPCFVIKNVMISRCMPLKNGHLALTLTGRGGGYLNAIAFRAADTEMGQRFMTSRDSYFHVAGTLKLDNWHGRHKVQFQVQDAANAL